ncbi:unnamed protein product [Allacma fusca]|uniref:Uncharacterized protein n=1 Tax=Allacma fusca TaxID=39272 RepID=A0A8J2K2P3_9HEXA|nr:unnamed protein product [Allacma fusca]
MHHCITMSSKPQRDSPISLKSTPSNSTIKSSKSKKNLPRPTIGYSSPASKETESFSNKSKAGSSKKTRVEPQDLPRASQIWAPIQLKAPNKTEKNTGKKNGEKSKGSKNQSTNKKDPSPIVPAEIKTDSRLYRYSCYRHFPDPKVTKIIQKTPKNTFDYINSFFKMLHISSGYHDMFVSRGDTSKTIVVCNLIRCPEDDYKGDFTAEEIIRVVNLPEDAVEYDLRTMFPTSHRVSMELRDDEYRADVHFKTPQLADEAEHMNFLINVGRLKLAWVRKDQLYLSDLPNDIEGPIIAQRFPGSTFLKFIIKDTGQKIAVLKFKTHDDADNAYEESQLVHLNRHHLAWSKHTPSIISKIVDEDGSDGSASPEPRLSDNESMMAVSIASTQPIHNVLNSVT